MLNLDPEAEVTLEYSWDSAFRDPAHDPSTMTTNEDGVARTNELTWSYEQNECPDAHDGVTLLHLRATQTASRTNEAVAYTTVVALRYWP